MKRLVIYTCVTAGYDPITDPAAICLDFDYVFFTDSPAQSDVWDIRPLPHTEADAHLTNRWYKMHPQVLFPEYEYSLWIDGNISICDGGFYESIKSLMDAGAAFAGVRHPERDDVYEESYRIYADGLDSLPALLRTDAFLRREGFPRHWGLLEANIILRKHSDTNVARADSLWWSMLSRYSRRDQMSQTYCLWKCSVGISYVLPKGMSARNCPWLTYTPHRKPYVKKRTPAGLIRDGWSLVRRSLFKLCLSVLMA